ncbi:rod-determining factor RdfA [Haladaptatus sp. GCM10025707]|uniref:rod-determining factor RdfA n=1 Tax=unclassified Haladaptatus TaxID=2622732 RepID=UPI0023E8F0EA|nr:MULTISPECIES: rod-determining factor RdfA [unclassified Haladaptatus]
MADENDGTTGRSSGRRSKVERQLETYDLTHLAGELERSWNGTGGTQQRSLRELATYFNTAMLESAMTEAGMQTLEGDVETAYRLLTDEEASSGDRLRLRRRLQRDGVDVDQLERDFVSYQAIRTFLTKYRGVEYESDDENRLERTNQSLQKLRGRTETVTQSKLSQLATSEDLTLGEFRVMVSVRVFCEDCGGQFELGELLGRGGCDCSPSL